MSSITITVAVSFAVMIAGAILYLLCTKPPRAAAFAELARIAFFVGLFFVVSLLANHVWRF